MKLGRNDACWCGSGRKYKKCHETFDETWEAYRCAGEVVPPKRLIKNEGQIRGIRESAKINTAVLDEVARRIRAGVTTEEIDRWVFEETALRGAVPAPLHYEGFPKSACVSVNDEVCHGIPAPERRLQNGDIVNVDISTIYGGFYSDASRMFCIGEVEEEKRRLVQVTRDSVYAGLRAVRPWGSLGDVGQAVFDFVQANGYCVVLEIGGHGIGLDFHEDPWVGFGPKRGREMRMAPGLCFTIEPMVNMGGSGVRLDAQNGWTVYTADGKPSAQWEIQVLVTETGYEVLAW